MDGTDLDLTSNMAFDRFLSIGALGYSNGMIVVLKVNSLRSEVDPKEAGRRRELCILEASDCEIL